MAFSKPARPCALLVPFQESQGGDGMSFPGCAGATPSFPAPPALCRLVSCKGWGLPALPQGDLTQFSRLTFLGNSIQPPASLHCPSAPPQGQLLLPCQDAVAWLGEQGSPTAAAHRNKALGAAGIGQGAGVQGWQVPLP